MKPHLQIDLFGGLRLVRNHETLSDFRTRKAVELLAYLALHPGEHLRECLMDLLWPETTPESARSALRVASLALRRQLEPPEVPAGTLLSSTRYNVALNHANVTMDTVLFEHALRVAQQGERWPNLMRAVELYQGPLLAGFYEDWISAEAHRLELLFARAARELIALQERQGDIEGALHVATHAVRVAPGIDDLKHHLHRLSTLLRTTQAFERSHHGAIIGRLSALLRMPP